MKFRLKEDWYTEIDFLGVKENQKIYDKDHVFTSNNNDMFIIETPYGIKEFTIEQMEEIEIFEKIKDDFYMNLSEAPDDDDEIKKWRIQLDITTTSKKIKNIEKFINDYLNKYL